MDHRTKLITVIGVASAIQLLPLPLSLLIPPTIHAADATATLFLIITQTSLEKIISRYLLGKGVHADAPQGCTALSI
jgi:hypothetical protein